MYVAAGICSSHARPARRSFASRLSAADHLVDDGSDPTSIAPHVAARAIADAERVIRPPGGR